jgi:hypothetical protein
MNMNGISWKTTVGGIVGVLSGLAIIAGTYFVPAAAWVTVPGGVGLISNGIANIMAKDKNVTGAGIDATTVKK